MKCADGKSISNKSSMEGLKEIQTLYEEIGCKTPTGECMIRSTKIRWLTCREDMEH